jgi:site-specific DNA-methyltransferase (adenine-specific)
MTDNPLAGLTSLTEKIHVGNIDCMKVMANLPDNYFDLAIVDPPYGIDGNNMEMGGRKTYRPDGKKWDTEVPTKEYFDELFRVSKNQIIWGGNYFTDRIPVGRYFCIWDKGETMYGRDFAECEFAWVRSGGTRIAKINPIQWDRIHPTQKPVALYEKVLGLYAKPGFKILDTHLGSGSIAIACYKLGYELVATEIDEDYFSSFIDRFNLALTDIPDSDQKQSFFD